MDKLLEPLRTWIKGQALVPDEQLTALLGSFTKKVAEPGGFLSRSGDAAPKIAYISSGMVKAFYADAHGEEYVKEFYIEGEIAANYAEAIESRSVELNLQFTEPTVAFCMDTSRFRAFFGMHPNWANLGRLLAEKYFLARDRRERLLLVDDAKSRYQHFLETHLQVAGRLKEYDIASYLGMNPSTLSRIKKS